LGQELNSFSDSYLLIILGHYWSLFISWPWLAMFIRRENTKTEYLFVSCTLTYPKLRFVLKFKKFKRFKMKKCILNCVNYHLVIWNWIFQKLCPKMFPNFPRLGKILLEKEGLHCKWSYLTKRSPFQAKSTVNKNLKFKFKIKDPIIPLKFCRSKADKV